jgi:hypothetical protein
VVGGWCERCGSLPCVPRCACTSHCDSLHPDGPPGSICVLRGVRAVPQVCAKPMPAPCQVRVPGACRCAWQVCVRGGCVCVQVRAGLHSPLAESDSSVAESRSMLSSSSSVLAGVSSASSSPIVQLRQSAVMVSEGWMRWHWCAGGENLPGHSLLHALKLECMRVASKTAPLRHRNAHARCSPLTGDDATLSARGS